MLRIKNEYLVVVAMGLLGIFYGYGSSYRSKFRSSLDLRSILYKKGLYIYFVVGVKFCSIF